MRSGFWGILAASALVACGDAGSVEDDAAADVVDEPTVDAAVETSTKDVATADVAKEADTGTPPLSCTGELDEPNGKEILATPLGLIDDCDSSGSSVHGVSSGIGDVDWMVFHGSDTFGCSVDPTLQINATGLRMCAFALCGTGTTTIQSCGTGTAAVSPAGTHGCCTTSTQSMSLEIACSATNDSAAIFVRVDQTKNQCVSYDVAYHY